MTAGGKGKEMRKRNTTVVILAALTLASMVAQNVEAAPPKGGKAEARMSEKGRANTNSQWSADPEKGWVRAEERQQVRDDKKEAKRNQLNRKGNRSKKNH